MSNMIDTSRSRRAQRLAMYRLQRAMLADYRDRPKQRSRGGHQRPSTYVLPDVQTRVAYGATPGHATVTAFYPTPKRVRPDHERPSRVYRHGETAPLS